MNLNNLKEIIGSSPADIEGILPLPNNVLKYKPKQGEVSFQQLDGTNVFQWNYRTSIYWLPSGPMFYLPSKGE